MSLRECVATNRERLYEEMINLDDYSKEIILARLFGRFEAVERRVEKKERFLEAEEFFHIVKSVVKENKRKQ